MMKRYALISVILLVAFMWSCENKSSSPFSPDESITLVKDGGSGTVTVAGKGGKGKGKVDKDATYTVKIYFEGAPVSGDPVGSPTDAGFFSANCLEASRMGLDLSALKDLIALWDDCSTFTDPYRYSGNFYICRNIMFRFKANGVNYTLLMPEDKIEGEGTWPPSTKITTFTGSKLQFKSGKKNACEGTVIIGWTIDVIKNPPPSP